MIKRPLCAAALLFLCIQAVLVGVFHIAQDLKPSALERELKSKRAVVLSGTVTRREEKPDYKVLYLKDAQVLLDNKIYQESKILVYIETSTHISIGNRIKVTGKADVFQTARNPGNFNQKFYYQKQGIHAFVWGKQIEVLEARIYRVREGLERLRAGWKKLLIDRLGKNYGNSMSAILLGDKSDLDSDLKDLYQKSGIGHILAISGLHMSFLGIGLYKLLRRSGLTFGLSGGTGICFLLAYTLMIGCGVSSIRAFVMFFVRMGADITGRDYDMPTSLSLAAAVIVAWQPLYLMDAGFLLSFGAILGILAVYPCLEFCFLKKTGNCRFRKSFLASAAINLMLLPVMLYFYFEFPPYSLLLNLLVIPLMSAVLGAGAIGSLVVLLSRWAGGMILQICKIVLFLYEKACQISMALPMSRIVTGQPAKIGIAGYYMILLLFCVSVYQMMRKAKLCKEVDRSSDHKVKDTAASNKERVERKRVRSFRTLPGCIAIGSLSVILGAACVIPCADFGKLTVTMVDVGQGDGLFLKGPKGSTYFIDGGSSDVSSVGTYRMEPFLKSQGIRTLDYAFISHGDADHMNGIKEMLEDQTLGIRIRNLVLPPVEVWDEALEGLAKKAKDSQTRIVAIKEGESLSEGGFRLTCKAPLVSYHGELGNAASMVLEASFGEFDMLFTGDLEGEGEKQLEESGGLKQYDILKVAHHGSKNSTSEKFLEQTRPEIAWISSGIHNRYGHPHAETIKRLKENGCVLYGTQEYGAVTIKTDGKKLAIHHYL